MLDLRSPGNECAPIADTSVRADHDGTPLAADPSGFSGGEPELLLLVSESTNLNVMGAGVRVTFRVTATVAKFKLITTARSPAVDILQRQGAGPSPTPPAAPGRQGGGVSPSPPGRLTVRHRHRLGRTDSAA